MRLYMVGVAYFGFGCSLSVTRCQRVEAKKEGRCR